MMQATKNKFRYSAHWFYAVNFVHQIMIRYKLEHTLRRSLLSWNNDEMCKKNEPFEHWINKTQEKYVKYKS
jgi:hypothetical protein